MLLFALFSCNPGETEPEKIFVTTDKSEISANGFDDVTITVSNEDGEDVTSGCDIFINDAFVYNNTFITSTPGSYSIRAEREGSISDTAIVVATDPGPASFTQKILAEDYTGAWCGYCPRVGSHLETYIHEKSANCIVVAVHNGDPMEYAYEAQMRSRYGISGFPTAIINRDFAWSESDTELDVALTRRPVLGLALETSLSGSIVSIKVKVKSDITTTTQMKLVVMLVEDKLIGSQRNYGYLGLPDPIENYEHNHVLRVAATDIFGDNIPTTAIVKDTEWTKDFTINAGSYNTANCRIVAFVVYGTDSTNRKGVLNVQEVRVGENKAYD